MTISDFAGPHWQYTLAAFLLLMAIAWDITR